MKLWLGALAFTIAGGSLVMLNHPAPAVQATVITPPTLPAWATWLYIGIYALGALGYMVLSLGLWWRGRYRRWLRSKRMNPQGMDVLLAMKVMDEEYARER